MLEKDSETFSVFYCACARKRDTYATYAIHTQMHIRCSSCKQHFDPNKEENTFLVIHTVSHAICKDNVGILINLRVDAQHTYM